MRDNDTRTMTKKDHPTTKRAAAAATGKPDGRGREHGTLVPGSLPWLIDQLEPGASMLLPDGPNRGQQLAVACSRYSAIHGGRYVVQACGGFPIATIDSTSFKFYRITRTE